MIKFRYAAFRKMKRSGKKKDGACGFFPVLLLLSSFKVYINKRANRGKIFNFSRKSYDG